MADNVPLPAAAGAAAADEATYSGDTTKIQLTRLVDIAGAEGAKTVESLWSRLVTANSSTSVLGAGAAFTGTSFECIDFSEILVNVYASHASATDGLSIQQSSDGTNWDIVDAYTVPATTGKVFSVQVTARYYRVVYTNGGTLQTDFRLQSYLRRVSSKGSSQRPADALSNENDFQQVSAFGSVFNGTTWDRQRGDATSGAFVAGAVAHDVADSGNPVKVGARAVSSLASTTLVAAADRAHNVSDLDGALIVRQDRPMADQIVERITNTNGTSTALTNFGATADARNVIDSCSGYNDSTTGGFVDIRDGAAGTVIWTFPLPAKGGFNHTWPRGLRQPTVNTALAYDVSAALTTVYLSFSGWKTKA